MAKFIFVCYDHGTGGEGLSVKISKRDYCNPIESYKQDNRTFTSDVLNKLLLKSSTEFTWNKQLPEIKDNGKYYVVPSHRQPKEIQNSFPDSIYVVINFPITSELKKHLCTGIKERVWYTSHSNLKEKMGFCTEYQYTINSQETLQRINKAVNNAEIHCIMNGMEYTEENVDILFHKKVINAKIGNSGMRYEDNDKIITLEYGNKNFSKLDRLDEICILHR